MYKRYKYVVCISIYGGGGGASRDRKKKEDIMTRAAGSRASDGAPLYVHSFIHAVYLSISHTPLSTRG